MLGVFDLFSKRQKEQRGEVPDVYIYVHISEYPDTVVVSVRTV